MNSITTLFSPWKLSGINCRPLLDMMSSRTTALHYGSVPDWLKNLVCAETFHLQGRTGYTSLFYNFDASTLQKHTETDWSITTIYIPNQIWDKNQKNHLWFLFHITEEQNGILNIAMQPGTIISFMDLCWHIRDMIVETSQKGLLYEFVAYANWQLLCHLISSIQWIKTNRKNI